MRKLLLSVILLGAHHVVNGQTINEIHYWFDDDSNNRIVKTIDGNSWKGEIDVSDINETLHTLYIQPVDSNKVAGAVISRHFIKTLMENDSVNYACWFDNDTTEIVNGKYTGEVIMLNVTRLIDGFHTLHIGGKHNSMLPTKSSHFIKIPQIIGVEYLTSMAFIDNKLFCDEKIAAPGGIINWNLDVDELSQGIHFLQLKAATPSGSLTQSSNHFFIRTATDSEISELKCFYALDNSNSYIESEIYDKNTFSFKLDVSSLDDGIHHISYMLTNKNGIVSNIGSKFFIKTSNGNEGITQYEYWINDCENKKTVTALEMPENPLILIEDLPVESLPIRA